MRIFFGKHCICIPYQKEHYSHYYLNNSYFLVNYTINLSQFCYLYFSGAHFDTVNMEGRQFKHLLKNQPLHEVPTLELVT